MLQNGIYGVGNARITFRNFRGEGSQYNKPGDRNFTLVLTPEQAEECAAIGFNVKVKPPRTEDGDPQFHLAVAVSFKHRPPKVCLISGKNKTYLGEESVGELDYADLANIDLTIRPYHWSMAASKANPDGSRGVKAYLNSGYFTLMEDEFAGKYDDIPSAEDELPFS